MISCSFIKCQNNSRMYRQRGGTYTWIGEKSYYYRCWPVSCLQRRQREIASRCRGDRTAWWNRPVDLYLAAISSPPMHRLRMSWGSLWALEHMQNSRRAWWGLHILIGQSPIILLRASAYPMVVNYPTLNAHEPQDGAHTRPMKNLTSKIRHC